MAPVLLGDIGRRLPEDEQLDLRLSRLGGVPSWPISPKAGRELPGQDAHGSNGVFAGSSGGTCRRCGQQRSFVAQFFAAYDGAPGGPCRMLHLFGCLAGGCGGDDSAWRVVRTTGHAPLLKEDTPATSSSAQATVGCVQASVETDAADNLVPGADDWGAGDVGAESWGASDDWGTSADAAAAQDAELAGLLAAREQSGGAIGSAASGCRGTAPPSSKSGAWQGIRGLMSSETTWPCFSLVIYEEPVATSVECGAHELELLERYRQSEEGGDLDTVLAAVQADPRSDTETDDNTGAQFTQDGDRDEDGDATWFVKFQQRIERSPTQVVRYSWGGRPLWISEPPEETTNSAWPPFCGRCGSSRVFEVQLLPTLLYQVRSHCPELPGDSEIEWGTIVVYTCAKDCVAEEPCDEFVLVQPAV